MERGRITIENNAVQILFIEGTVWLSQHQIANLLDCYYSKVNSNIRSILKSGMLCQTEVMKTHRFEGGSVDLYNLDMIMALAYHINSPNASTFRRWLVKRMAVRSPAVQLPIVIHYKDGMWVC